jgi:hypothetical protein
MSDTPETDDKLNYNAFGFYTMGGLPTDAVCVDFARKLERERDAFEQELFYVREVLLDEMPNAHGSTKKLAEMIVAERDLWKENSQSNRDEYYRLAAERDKLEVERDLWKAEAERWRGIR